VTIPIIPVGFINNVYFEQKNVQGMAVSYLGSSAANGAFVNVTKG